MAADEKPAIVGYGPWKLGDSREAVRAVESHGPYLDVRSTGGLETYAGEFLGEPTHISFVFGDAGLFLIQLWLYNGGEEGDFEAATAALHRAYGYLQTELGALHSDGLVVPESLTLDGLRRLVPEAFRDQSQRIDMSQALTAGARIKTNSLSFHLHPRDPPPGADVSASLFYNPQLGMYWVFLYFRNDRPAADGHGR
jgi:hypothetical protein